MSKRSAETYNSDGGFVQEDSNSPPPKSKRAKTTKMEGGKDSTSKGNDMLKDENGDSFWELTPGGGRRVTLNTFKGKMMVNLREYYESGGKRLPGKKGISMPIDQFAVLVEVLPQIERALADKGQIVPRPEYDKDVDDGGLSMAVEEDPAGEGSSKKQNFEATSSEDDE